MSNNTFDDIGSAMEAVENGDVETDTGNGDYERYPRVKLTPTAGIRGEVMALEYTGDPTIKHNIDGASSFRDEGDFIVRLRNPQVENGTVYEAAGRGNVESRLADDVTKSDIPFTDVAVDSVRTPSRDFRVIDDDMSSCPHIDPSTVSIPDDETESGFRTEMVGVELYGSQFVGHETTFDEALEMFDIVDVFIGGRKGRIIAQSLDTQLGRSAFMTDEGGKATGLVEYPNNYDSDSYDPDDDGHPRAARNPQLHSEIEGNEVVLYEHYGDLDEAMSDEGDESDSNSGGGRYRTIYADLLIETDDGWGVGTQQRLFEPEEGTVDEGDMWLEYADPDGGFGTAPTSDTATSTTTDGGTDVAMGADGSPSPEEQLANSGGLEPDLDFDDLQEEVADEQSPTTMDDLSPIENEYGQTVLDKYEALIPELSDDQWETVFEGGRKVGVCESDESRERLKEALEYEVA